MNNVLLLRRARLLGASASGQLASSEPVDVWIADGKVLSMRPAGQIEAQHTATLDAEGRFLLPGLWDHHVHFSQWTTQRSRLDLGGTGSAAQVLEVTHRAVITHEQGPLVGFGYRSALWPDEPTADGLDEVAGAVPVVHISADLHSAWVSSAAARLLEVQPDPDGVVREGPWFAALERLSQYETPTMADYRATAEAAAALGVVGIVDFENDHNVQLWPQRVAAGVNSLRVVASVWPERLADAIAVGLRTGDALDDAGLVSMGPLKVISDGSLTTRTAWCHEPYGGAAPGEAPTCGGPTVPPDQVLELMRRARDAGIAAAIHAIGDRANTQVLDSFEQLGMTGRIEHAQLLRPADMERLAQLGVVASVQPEHAMDDRDLAEVYWSGRTHRAFPLAGLHAAGVDLLLGSDAPVSPLDPWAQISAAVTRSRGGRDAWHPEQRISMATALGASTGGRTGVRVGDPADLILVDEDPFWADDVRNMQVAATLLGGRLTHQKF